MSLNNFTKYLSISFVCLACTACKHKRPEQITKAFYYWKTDFNLSAFEKKRLDSFGCQTLYVRFFDIDWNADANEPKPIAVNRFVQPASQGLRYVPVIFITQEVLNRISVGNINELVKNFTNLLYEKCIQAKINPAEIQIDCDWTINNKDKYFQLLNLCKKQSFFQKKILSCTIRLHQLRYLNVNGVPPVDKGLLMCYNMGNLKLAGDNNSILDLAVAERYLDRLQSYPLPLDIALPLFSWSLLYDNDNRFTGILRGIEENDLRNNLLFDSNKKNLYNVKKDTLWRGYNLKTGETVRYESCSQEDLYKLANFVSSKTQHISTLIFYHCDSATLSKHDNYELEKIYRSFD